MFEYCRLEHNRCPLRHNKREWPLQEVFGHVRIILPPPQQCEVPTRIMLEDSQRMDVTDFWVRSYIPTSSSEASDSDVSPSLVDSDEIRREFGPRANPDANAGDDLLEDDDAILLQTPAAGSSDPIPTAAQAVGQIVNDSCLLGTHPYWLRALSAAFLQDAAIERADIGPTALLTAWYIDASAESTNEDSHAIQLDHQANLWAHDIQQLWQDKVQPDHRVYFAWVNPKPRESPLARTLGHLFVFQKPQETLAPVLMTFHFQALKHGWRWTRSCCDSPCCLTC